MTLLTTDGLAAVASLWKKSHRQIVAAFGGTSMLPTIAPNQNVTIRCGEEGTIGDVVVAIADSEPIVHRVIAVDPRGRWLLTRGDANVFPDIPLRDRDAIIGRLAARECDGRMEPIPSHAATTLQRVILALCLAVLSLWFWAGCRLIEALIAVRRLSIAALLVVRRALAGS